MVHEYTLNIQDGLSTPLNDTETDTERLGQDAANQLHELQFFSGDSTVEYGGEAPWTHVWTGRFIPLELPEYWQPDDNTIDAQAEVAVEKLLSFFDNSCTPHGTTTDDFTWTVEISTRNISVLPDGYHSIQVIWTPTEE